MSPDLLARIAKALEGNYSATPISRDVYLADAARQLLPEAHAALKIAVEALEFVANIDKMEAQGVVVSAPDLADLIRWYLTECRNVARAALSRLASAAEGQSTRWKCMTCGATCDEWPQTCPIHGQPSGEGK